MEDEPKLLSRPKSEFLGRRRFVRDCRFRKRYLNKLVLIRLVHARKLGKTRFDDLLDFTQTTETDWKTTTATYRVWPDSFARGYFQCAYDNFPDCLNYDINDGKRIKH